MSPLVLITSAAGLFARLPVGLVLTKVDAGCSEDAVFWAELNPPGGATDILVHACSGVWPSSTPGVESGAALLCGEGFHLCTYDDMQFAGENQCDNLGGFFASAVSSDGSYNCNTDNSGTNDVWGCGSHCNHNKDCGMMDCILNSNGGYGWQGMDDPGAPWDEKDTAYRVGSQAGGVLCCGTPTPLPTPTGCSAEANFWGELNNISTMSTLVRACSGVWPSSTPGVESGAALLC